MIDDIDHRTGPVGAGLHRVGDAARPMPVADETPRSCTRSSIWPRTARDTGAWPAAGVETALRRALRKKPTERFSSMREFRAGA